MINQFVVVAALWFLRSRTVRLQHQIQTGTSPAAAAAGSACPTMVLSALSVLAFDMDLPLYRSSFMKPSRE